MKKYTMLVNSLSSNYNFEEIKKCWEMILATGASCNLCFTTTNQENFIEEFFQQAKKANAQSDIVITYGGDGFFGLYQEFLNKNGTKNRNGEEIIIGHIPIGTTNDMALNLGLTNDCVLATKEILEAQVAERDIVTSNNTAFGYVSAFGAVTNIPFDTSYKLKKMGNKGYLVAAIPEIARTLIKPKIYKINYTSDRETKNMDCIIGIISNANGFGSIEVYQEVNQNDGEFEVLLISPKIVKKAPELIKYFYNSLVNGQQPNIDLLKLYPEEIVSFSTSNLKIEFLNKTPKYPLDNDGDKGPLLNGNILNYKTRGKCLVLTKK